MVSNVIKVRSEVSSSLYTKKTSKSREEYDKKELFFLYDKMLIGLYFIKECLSVVLR